MTAENSRGREFRDRDGNKPKYASFFEPTLHHLPFYDRGSMDVIWRVQEKIATETGILLPISKKMYEIPTNLGLIPRMTISFDLDVLLTNEQIDRINALVKDTYYSSQEIRSVDYKKPGDYNPINYPKMPESRSNAKISFEQNYIGHLVGPDVSNGDINALTEGVFVLRKLPPKVANAIKNDPEFPNFLTYTGVITNNKGESLSIKPQTKIEIRDGHLTQVEFLELVLGISSILSNKELPEGLYARIYDEIIAYKLKDSPDHLPGTKSIQEEINRRLIIPVANPEQARKFKLRPQNLLLVGPPGSGKTELAKLTLRAAAKQGVVVQFLTTAEYAEMLLDEKKIMRGHIQRIKKKTGRDVILVVDDIEEIGGDKERIRSIMMNDLQGATSSDYYLLCTSNYPERMTGQVVNPERLWPIYCGLPNEEARKLILYTHVLDSIQDGEASPVSLFRSIADLDRTLQDIAEHTEGLDSRNLRQICTEAASRLFQRTITKPETPAIFTDEDWGSSCQTVMFRADIATIQKRCREIQEFVEKGRKRVKQLETPNS